MADSVKELSRLTLYLTYLHLRPLVHSISQKIGWTCRNILSSKILPRTLLMHWFPLHARHQNSPPRNQKQEINQTAAGSSTVMPMFLAVPATIFIAASIVTAFRSGILVSAISCKTVQHMVLPTMNKRTIQLIKRTLQCILSSEQSKTIHYQQALSNHGGCYEWTSVVFLFRPHLRGLQETRKFSLLW